MTTASHPFFAPPAREHTEGPFSRDEVQLANRNPGTLLESLRHDLTPIGLHYLLIHFDVPFVETEADWKLSVSGLVNSPLNLTVEDLRKLPERSLTVTLE